MDQKIVDKNSYRLAKEFLLGLPEVTPELLDKYLNLTERNPRPATMAGIYKRLLESAQNANMKSAVIGGSIDGLDNLGPVLIDFEPAKVIDAYGDDWERLLDNIEEQLKPRGEMRRTSRSIWPQFCKSVLSGAQFLAQFEDAESFYNWVSFFDQNDIARPALPLLISQEISGLGYPLACDFIKELGYINFSKPDVHLKDIFKGLGLCSAKAGNYEVFKAIVRVARNVGVSAYKVDKLFWLIGSGYFYLDPDIGKNGRVGRNKKRFIEYARNELSKATDS